MQCHWLRDKQTQQLIKVHWDKGANNLADYHTKYHPTKYHLEMRTKNKLIQKQLTFQYLEGQMLRTKNKLKIDFPKFGRSNITYKK